MAITWTGWRWPGGASWNQRHGWGGVWGDGASDWDPGIRLEGMPGEEKVIKIKFCEG